MVEVIFKRRAGKFKSSKDKKNKIEEIRENMKLPKGRQGRLTLKGIQPVPEKLNEEVEVMTQKLGVEKEVIVRDVPKVEPDFSRPGSLMTAAVMTEKEKIAKRMRKAREGRAKKRAERDLGAKIDEQIAIMDFAKVKPSVPAVANPFPSFTARDLEGKDYLLKWNDSKGSYESYPVEEKSIKGYTKIYPLGKIDPDTNREKEEDFAEKLAEFEKLSSKEKELILNDFGFVNQFPKQVDQFLKKGELSELAKGYKKFYGQKAKEEEEKEDFAEVLQKRREETSHIADKMMREQIKYEEAEFEKLSYELAINKATETVFDGSKFEKGQSPRSTGRPKGSKNKIRVALEQIGEENAKEVYAKLVEKALEGDINACKIILDRVFPRKGCRFNFEIEDPIDTIDDVAKFSKKIINMMAAGLLSAEEASEYGRVVEQQLKTITDTEMMNKIEVTCQKVERIKNGA